jgi:Putative amidase domain
MVTFAQLRDARPELWAGSGDEWLAVAGHAFDAATDLRSDVQAPLAGGAWTDHAGHQAATSVQELVDALTVASLECRSVGYICKGFGHVLKIAQDSLGSALGQATKAGLTVDDTGTVHLPADPMIHHDPELAAEYQQARSRVITLIDDAVDAASQADRKVHDMLDRFAQAVNVTSVDQAENTDLRDAAQTELALLAGTIPHGSRDQVAAWWSSLPDDDRKTLLLGVPAQLEGLDGIPADVKAGLKGNSRYDHTKVAQWAMDHWSDNSDDPFDDNCTNFASDALQGGGVPMKDGFWGTFDGDSWDKGVQTGWGWFDEHNYSHSGSWAQAQTSYDFWRQHGTEVGVQDAQPGDIIYWERDDGSGTVHHAAVVTGVVDGDIRYTQHSGNQLNASLDGREPLFDAGDGKQKIHIVRVNPDW